MDGSPKPGQFWGKYNKDENCWHPLIHHCCDVSACFQTLMEKLAVLRKRLARSGDLNDLSDVKIQRLSALAAIHDFGKFNHGFQNKILPSKKYFPKRGHIREALSAFDNTEIQQKIIKALALENLVEWFESDEILTQYILTILSHHGEPTSLDKAVLAGKNWQPSEGVDPVMGVAELMDKVREWFPGAFETAGENEKLPSSPYFQHAFCGLVQLSDWIGSSETFFRFSDSPDDDRYSFSRKQAGEVLEKMGMIADLFLWHISDELPSFSTITGKDWDPRPLQNKFLELDTPQEEGSIVCLEAETGSGKTEAAFIHFLKLYRAGKIEGMYFALPTRSAATQIYKRIHQMTVNSFGANSPPVVLAVPGYIEVDQVKGERGGTLPRFEVLWKDKDRFRFRGWAAEHPKRYMAAPIIVGTIDQVLLSSLQVSHAHLRASALLRHLIVVDEVHSSDDYMNTILLETLKYHIKVGGHALLMSATLGAETRNMFINLNTRTPDTSYSEAVTAPYPACSIKGERTEGIARDNRSKEIYISILQHNYENNENIAREAFNHARNGACVIILRNTVADAISTQRQIEKIATEQNSEELLFRCKDVVTPHHGRYHPEDRKSIDEALEKRFSSIEGRSPGVVVTTQTVEQSLDVDFDFMITDLCPMDVLLQRAGRLHRHDVVRPEGFKKAQLQIIVPEADLISMLIDGGILKKGTPAGIGSVYENLAILQLTRENLNRNSRIIIPEMNRELVESSVNAERIEQMINNNENSKKWKRHLGDLKGKILAKKAGGRISIVPREEPFGEVNFPDHSEEKIPTRLGQADRLVKFKENNKEIYSPFGNSLTFMKIPGWMLSDGEIQGENIEALKTNNGIKFSIAGIDFIYNRLGLQKVK